jgi:hypothetical protein
MALLAETASTALQFWYLVVAGIVVVAVFVQRGSQRFDDLVARGLSCLERELDGFPDVLYSNLHPNWSVFRKKFQHTLRSTCPGITPEALAYVLEQFDTCYEYDDGVYSKFDSMGREPEGSEPAFVPLVAPFEQRHFRTVESRRRRRSVLRFAVGGVTYLVAVTLVIGFLVFARGQGW